jgi:hypothetical protein
MNTHTATDERELTPALFADFIRENKAGSIGNTLAHSGIVRWEGERRNYPDNPALYWWKSPKPLVIDWHIIKATCNASNTSGKDSIRNIGDKKIALLRKFMGIQPPPKASKIRPICSHCGQRYRPMIKHQPVQP